MRLFVLRRKIGSYWRKRPIVRGATAVLVLTAAIILQYYLANRPLPIDVNDGDHKYTPAIAKFKQEELLIENPALDSDRVLLSLDRHTDGFVNVHFGKARLGEETLTYFQEKSTTIEAKPPPTGLEEINYVTEKVEQKTDVKSSESARGTPKSDDNGTCLISVEVRVTADSKPPTQIHFYRPEGSKESRGFLLIVDADLVVRLSTSPSINKENRINAHVEGCMKHLTVGDWAWRLAVSGEVKIIAAANSVLHFTFVQHKQDPLWKGPNNLFQPFMFGAKPLRAQAVSVNTFSGDRPSTPPLFTILSASVKKGDPLLNINRFMVNAEEIQLDFSGTALVQTHGEYITGDLLDRLRKYRLVTGLLAMGDAALLGWFGHIFRGILKGKRQK